MGLQVKAFALELLSLDTPRAVVVVFSSMLLFLASVPTAQLRYLPIRSIWETVFHITPYSSGMMRGLSRLLHGDMGGAMAFNRLAPITLTVMLTLIAINAYRWRSSGKIRARG